MLDLNTLSGLYENARTVVRLTKHTHMAQGLRALAQDDRKLYELGEALEKLETHLRVAGGEAVSCMEKG